MHGLDSRLLAERPENKHPPLQFCRVSPGDRRRAASAASSWRAPEQPAGTPINNSRPLHPCTHTAGAPPCNRGFKFAAYHVSRWTPGAVAADLNPAPRCHRAASGKTTVIPTQATTSLCSNLGRQITSMGLTGFRDIVVYNPPPPPSKKTIYMGLL